MPVARYRPSVHNWVATPHWNQTLFMTIQENPRQNQYTENVLNTYLQLTDICDHVFTSLFKLFSQLFSLLETAVISTRWGDSHILCTLNQHILKRHQLVSTRKYFCVENCNLWPLNDNNLYLRLERGEIFWFMGVSLRCFCLILNKIKHNLMFK